MTTVRASRRKLSAGSQVRRLRLSSLLTQQELAEVAGVSQEEVNLFEQGLPVPLDSKRKILKELWAIKAKK